MAPEDTEADPDAVAPLAAALDAPEPSTRADALAELTSLAAAHPGRVADEASAIRDRLDDPDPSVRAAACRLVGTLGLAGAEDRLRDRRLDADPEVSEAARAALSRLDDPDAPTPDVTTDDPDDRARRRARRIRRPP